MPPQIKDRKITEVFENTVPDSFPEVVQLKLQTCQSQIFAVFESITYRKK